jgi:hypothetical protein
MRIRLLAVSVALMIAGGMAEAQDRLLTVTCAEAGALELPVPEGWTVQESRHDVRMPPTVTCRPRMAGRNGWSPRCGRLPTGNRRRRCRKYAPGCSAPRKRLAQRPHRCSHCPPAPTGYFFDAGADITPEPYTQLRQGMLKVGALTVSFTAMSAAGRTADQDAAVDHVGRATHRP